MCDHRFRLVIMSLLLLGLASTGSSQQCYELTHPTSCSRAVSLLPCYTDPLGNTCCSIEWTPPNYTSACGACNASPLCMTECADIPPCANCCKYKKIKSCVPLKYYEDAFEMGANQSTLSGMQCP